MIRNCIIYELSKRVVAEPAQDIERLSLRQVAEGAKGNSRRRLLGLKSECRKEKVKLTQTRPDFAQYECSCEFRAKKFTAAGDSLPPYERVRYTVWVGRKSPWVVTFDAGRRLSAVATTLLGQGLVTDPSAIKPVFFEKPVFDSVVHWVTQPERGEAGRILRVTLGNVQVGGANFNQLVLRGDRIEKSDLFSRGFDSAQFVSNLMFETPSLEGSSRQLSCTLGMKGGITIYTEKPMTTEELELVNQLYSFSTT